MTDFFKFPSTVHLAAPRDVDLRDDKVLSKAERSAFLERDLIVEEKIDGANLGLSFDADGGVRAQNRGDYLNFPAVGQWKHLSDWLMPRTDALFDHLTDRLILFGEWCYARHSVAYDRLPDWFLAFDIYDRVEERFWSCRRRDEILASIGLARVPELAHGRFTISGLEDLMRQSRVGDAPAEGLYMRVDSEDWLEQRAKLVRTTFVQSIEKHWAHSAIAPNRLGQQQ